MIKTKKQHRRAIGGNGYATPSTKKRGAKAEIEFETIMHQIPHVNCTVATKKQQLHDHYDFIVNNIFPDNKTYRFEVKAIKSPKRGACPNPSILFVELLSVGGYPGWIKGKATHIAFQIPKGFLVFSRQILDDYTTIFSQLMPLSTKSGIPGTKYGRRGRKDLVVIFKTNDVMNALPYFIFRYDGTIFDSTTNKEMIVKKKFHPDVSYKDFRTYAEVVSVK